MDSADTNDQQMNNEQPGPSQSSLAVETADGSQDASPSQNSGDMQSSTLNLYTALGLSPEDVDALAQIPENEISIETLPRLIMQLKAKRAQSGGHTLTSSPKEEVQNDQEDREADRSDSVPRRSKSKATVHSDSADYSYSKNESQERSGHERSRRESRHSKTFVTRRPKFSLSSQMDDFRGTRPRSFPHTCSLCDCILDSATWHDHLGGSRHEEGKREFLRAHPDLHDASCRLLEPHPGGGDVGRDSRSSSRRRSYASDFSPGDWHYSPHDRHLPLKPKAGTKVVVTKFLRGTVGVEDLLSLAKPFGTVVKHLIFPCKGFLEFSTHQEAVDMVFHYASKPAYVKDNKLALYLSPVVGSIHTPKLDKVEKRPKRSLHAVVCFSHLPPDKESEPELLEVAKMFGEVRYSKVYNNEILIEMEDWNDADIMVKYYHTNPLKIFGKNVRVSMSSSHKLPRLSPDQSRRGDSSRSYSSLSKSKETSRSSHPKNKEKTSETDVTEKKNVDEEDQRATEEDEHMDVKLDSAEEEEQGMKVEDEQDTSEELEHADTVTENEEPKEEPDASQKEDLESSGVEMDQSSEDITPSERPPAKSPENPDETSTFPVLTEEPTSAENLEDILEDTKDIIEEYNGSEEDDMDFPDNMEDFVTLDELDNDGEKFDSDESSEGGKVVTVRRIRKGYGLESSLMKLAEPFGKVTNHAISFYRQEALLELESHEAAKRMIKYYQGSKKALIFGRPVSVSMCWTLQQLEGPSGKSIYIGMLPLQKYSDVSLLRLAQPFGQISGYHLNWRRRKCYIQMESVEAAQKMAQKYSQRPPKFFGSVLRICMCRKGDSQIPWKLPVKYQLWCEQQMIRKSRRDSLEAEGEVELEMEAEEDIEEEVEGEAEAENGQSAEGPNAKKRATEDGGQSAVSDSDGAVSTRTGGQMRNKEENLEQKSVSDPVSLGPYQPNNPVGIDYIVQRTGFFCKLCKVFYTNEKTAKSLHCSSLAHYQKLKIKLAEEHPSE